MQYLGVSFDAHAGRMPRLAAAVAVVGMSLSVSYTADAADILSATPHRLDFEVTPGLPKCNDEDAFRALLTNWIRTRSLDPTARRKIIVRIKALRDGGKKVDLSLIDPEGQTVESESHAYPSDEECFRVLYWTAFDTVKLLKRVTPPEAEPDVEVEIVEKNSGKRPEDSSPVQDKPNECPAIPEAEQPSVRQEQTLIGTRSFKNHLVLGTGMAFGLTRIPMIGTKVGYGRAFGPLTFEVDTRLFSPFFLGSAGSNSPSRAWEISESYLASGAICMPRTPLWGCLVATGGLVGYRFVAGKFGEDDGVSSSFLLGFRAGFEKSLTARWSLRFDIEGQTVLHESRLVTQPASTSTLFRPALTTFVTVIPHF